MAPSHFIQFQRFNDRIDNQLEASVAFGLFMEGEQIWAAHVGDPSNNKFRNYHEQLTDFDIERWADNARIVLSSFGTDAVAAKRAEILQENLKRYELAASKGHRAFRWWGVVEALFGAVAWTMLLILFSFVLKYYGIDLIEVFHKVAGH